MLAVGQEFDQTVRLPGMHLASNHLRATLSISNAAVFLGAGCIRCARVCAPMSKNVHQWKLVLTRVHRCVKSCACVFMCVCVFMCLIVSVCASPVCFNVQECAAGVIVHQHPFLTVFNILRLAAHVKNVEDERGE